MARLHDGMRYVCELAPVAQHAGLVDATTGDAVGVEALPLHLRRARLTRVNTEANGSVCRGMLSHRYGTRGEGQLEEIP